MPNLHSSLPLVATQALARYQLRQLTSAEVIERLVELAKKLREARRRHEALGLTTEEAAFYDAVAGSSDDREADPEIVAIARDLVTKHPRRSNS